MSHCAEVVADAKEAPGANFSGVVTIFAGSRRPQRRLDPGQLDVLEQRLQAGVAVPTNEASKCSWDSVSGQIRQRKQLHADCLEDNVSVVVHRLQKKNSRCVGYISKSTFQSSLQPDSCLNHVRPPLRDTCYIDVHKHGASAYVPVNQSTSGRRRLLTSARRHLWRRANEKTLTGPTSARRQKLTHSTTCNRRRPDVCYRHRTDVPLEICLN